MSSNEERENRVVPIEEIAAILERAKTHIYTFNNIGRRLAEWANYEIQALENSKKLYQMAGKQNVVETINVRITQLTNIIEELNEIGELLDTDFCDVFIALGADVDDGEESEN